MVGLLPSLVLCAILLCSPGLAAPASGASTASYASSAAEPSETVPLASDNPNGVLWSASETNGDPQPIRGSLGSTIMAEQNVELQRQNPDLLAPPTTDHGTMSVHIQYFATAAPLT